MKTLIACIRAACLFLALASGAHAADTLAPSTVDKIKDALLAAGYKASDGRIFFSSACTSTTNCNLNNPGSVYGVVAVPVPLNPDPVNQPGAFRMGAGEAILILMRTPPESRYFGVTNYVRSRVASDGTGTRKDLFASMGDSANHLTLATSGTPDGAAGDAFDQWTVIIVTAHQPLDSLLRSTLASTEIGIPPQIVNSFPLFLGLPIYMGLGAPADSFQIVFRVAVPADEAALQAYLDKFDPKSSAFAPPAAVLRVSPQTVTTPVPFPTPELRPAETGSTEEDIRPGLGASFAALQAAVRQRYGSLASRQVAFVENVDAHGRLCLRDYRDCLGDTYDATYLYAPSAELLPDAADDFIVVIGVNHHATGKTSYTNISISRLQGLVGLKSIFDPDLAGSARTYVPDDPNADFLYAHKFARHCNREPFCFEVDPAALTPQQAALFIERAYLDPATRTHPAGSEIVFPVLLHFSPQ